MVKVNPRDHSRTAEGKTRSLVRKNTSPPRGEVITADSSQRWQWFTVEFMQSPAFRLLSRNANTALFRIVVEHVCHGAVANGHLLVTHQQFAEHGVTGEYVADAIDELAYKGLIVVQRGRAGNGTAHPNEFRLTFVGDLEGAPATNEWRKCSEETCRRWDQVDRRIAADQRASVGRKRKSSLRTSEIRPLRDSEIRAVS